MRRITAVLKYLAALCTTYLLMSLDSCSLSIARGTTSGREEATRLNGGRYVVSEDLQEFAIYRNAFR
jgi:hypothetical protein